MKLVYEKCGDHLVPNLQPNPKSEGELWKYGMMRENYLENHHRGIYSGMLLEGNMERASAHDKGAYCWHIF